MYETLAFFHLSLIHFASNGFKISSLHLDVIHMIKPRPMHALHGGVSCFAFVCVSVCLSVCVSVYKISQKIFSRSTSFLVEAFPVTQGGNHSILKKRPRGKGGGCVGVEIWP